MEREAKTQVVASGSGEPDAHEEENAGRMEIEIRKEVRWGNDTYPYDRDMGLSANGREKIVVARIDFIPIAYKLKQVFQVTGEIVKIPPRYLVKTEDGRYKVEGTRVRSLRILGYYPRRDVLALEVEY